MPIGNGSGRNVQYEVEPADPGLVSPPNDPLWVTILKFLGLL